jgi:uncharacterized protein
MNAKEGRTLVGYVAEIYRYPVKSMQGECLERTTCGPNGLPGDRRFAVIDAETGRVASAKQPRKWSGLLDLGAELRDGALVVTAADGAEYRSNHDDLDAVLSGLLGRAVALRGPPHTSASMEIEWPDVPGYPDAASESIEVLPPGGYFDLALMHLLTTATLRRFRELSPHCGFETRRFRPNVVIETLPVLSGFVERDWCGRRLLLGDLTARVSAPCSRCVMTTLSQPGLPADPQVLQAVVAYNAATAGAYIVPVGTGELAVGNPIWLE